MVQVICTVRAANWLEAALFDLHFSIWKKSRLISLTNSGCLGYFVFIKVTLGSVWHCPDGLSLKTPLLKRVNSCLGPGETRGDLDPDARRRILQPKFSSTLCLEHLSFGLWFLMPRLILQTSAALANRVFKTLAVTAVRQMDKCNVWEGTREKPGQTRGGSETRGHC